MSLQDFEPPVAYEASLDARMGVRHDRAADTDDLRHGSILVTPGLCDRHGKLAGGVVAAIAEGLASAGTFEQVLPDGNSAQGLSNDTTLMADVGPGTEVHCVARCVGRAPGEWVWSIESTAADGTPVALSRVTVAVRPIRLPTS